MDHHEDIGSEDNSSTRPGNNRLLVTHEGLLDQTLLKRTEGYMHKKGGAVNARGGFRNWKKRWFVVAPVEILGAQGFELQYYDAPNGNLKGKVGLSEIEILSETKSQHKSVKFEFQIVLQNGGTLELSCDDAGERDEWIETLNMITAFLKKVLTSGATMTLDGYDPFDDDDQESFNIGEEIAQNCQAFGPGLFGAEAGTQSQLVVQVHDLVGQQVTRGGMPVTVALTNAECVYYMRVIDNGDGTYFSQYVLGRAGKYKLIIRLNDEHDIFGSPFDVEILPSRTIARFCTAHGDALSSIVANETQTFTIIAMDGYGNRKINGGDPFEVGVMGPAQLRSLTDNADGTYTCTIAAHNPSAAAYVTSSSLMIMVTLHGKPIAGSPFKPIITEDLRAIYAQAAGGNGGTSVASYNNNNSPLPSSAASVASSHGGAGGGGSVANSQQQHQQPYYSKHVMAQQQPPPFAQPMTPYATGTGAGVGAVATAAEMSLQDLDGDGGDDDEAEGEGMQEYRRQQQQLPPQTRPGGPPAAAGASSNASVASKAASNTSLSPMPAAGAAGSGRQGGAASVASAATGGGGASVASNRSQQQPLQQGQRGQQQAPYKSAAPPVQQSASGAAAAALAATNAAGGGLSRLERSRQRALLAKALSESNTNNNNNFAAAQQQQMQDQLQQMQLSGQQGQQQGQGQGQAAYDNNTTAGGGGAAQAGASATGATGGGRKLTKLEELQRSMATGAGNANTGGGGGGNSSSATGGGGAQTSTAQVRCSVYC